MKNIPRPLFSPIFLTTLFAAVLNSSTSPAATPCDPVVARIVSVQGDVEVRRAGQTQSQPARFNDAYCAGDRIQVGERSRADLSLVNQPLLRLDQNTTITLGGMREERTSLIDMARGALHFFSRLPRNLEVNTAFVNAGVEGTEGLVEVEADRALVTIFEGRVLAANPAGSLTLTDGQSAVAERGKAPVLRTVVRPRDAVQWALYYPPVTYFRPEDFQGPEPWRGMVQKSLDAYMKGDYQAAFEAIKGVPADIREPRFFAYRAQLLLGVGRVDEASKDIQQALSINPNYGDALALQSIIAVVQNDKERALENARKAVAADPKSASALIAQSYAQQANFDLEGARTSLQQAVQASPNDALAWARLAELHMSFAELDEALAAAQKAVSLNPNLSRTQMVLGFAHLLRVDTDEAKAAFERAIALDQADSLSRLGLGLAKIRESNFEDGRRDIEIAASLDPNNSIVRSYLGKAYYEEKRTELVDREYATAKELDPRDPTPYFYDAIHKQTTNRPVEALQDMEKAIELNENRAVYRSQLQLDADLAARSASLARIYTDLGFQQLALVEGWKSVNTDPSNFSAHRFLADTYSILPRHEIARVSELLQSQLLQPLNMTPIQPRLAESNLFLISASGPGTLSFNEFNPIFNRNGITFQTTGLVGERDTYSGEGVLSGIYKNLSFSFGGTHFQTDGFRKNADQRDDIGNAFLQLELSPQTSIQTEYRYRKNEFGDIRLKFFPESVFPTQRFTSENNTIRFGARHAFSPNSIVLTSIFYRDGKFRERHEPFPQPGVLLVDLDQPDQRAVGGELQYLLRSRYVNLRAGGGYFDVGDKVEQLVRFGFPFLPGPPFTPPTIDVPGKTNLDLRHANIYAYTDLNFLKNVTITAGVSFDHADSKFLDEVENQANPKFGIIWTPFAGTTVRGSAFRALKRTLVAQQTLEPTQVSGFNQFFDDFDLTESWRYGGAIDQKFSTNVYGGLEFSKRKLDVPFLNFAVNAQSPPTQKSDWDEYLGRAYLFWAAHEWLTLRAEYVYERLKRKAPFVQGVTEADTHRIPLGINFFHPSGLSSRLAATYFTQTGEFGGFFATDPIRTGSSNFWTVDAAINYRLPKRYGFITVGATNLLDRHFRFFDSDLRNASIQPRRTGFFRVTLALP